jgi:hypothetical protein
LKFERVAVVVVGLAAAVDAANTVARLEHPLRTAEAVAVCSEVVNRVPRALLASCELAVVAVLARQLPVRAVASFSRVDAPVPAFNLQARNAGVPATADDVRVNGRFARRPIAIDIPAVRALRQEIGRTEFRIAAALFRKVPPTALRDIVPYEPIVRRRLCVSPIRAQNFAGVAVVHAANPLVFRQQFSFICVAGWWQIAWVVAMVNRFAATVGSANTDACLQHPVGAAEAIASSGVRPVKSTTYAAVVKPRLRHQGVPGAFLP